MRLKISFFFFSIVVLGVLFYWMTSNRSPRAIEEIVTANLQAVLQAQQQDIDQFENELAVYTNPFSIKGDATFSKRVFVNGGLVYWTDNQFYPEYGTLKKSDTLYTIKDDFGVRIVKRRQVVTDRDLIEIFSIVTLYESPPVKNQYLSDHLNSEVFEAYELRVTESGLHSFAFNDTPLFKADIPVQGRPNGEWIGLIILLLIGTLCVWFFMEVSVRYHYSKLQKSALLVLTIVGWRLILYWYTQTGVSDWDLFNPVFFAADLLNPTLGDLLANGLVLFTISAIVYSSVVGDLPDWVSKLSRQRAIGTGVLVSIVIVVAGWLVYGSTWLLLEHSQVELDISSSIVFNELRISAYAFLILIGLSVMLIFSMCQLILFILPVDKKLKYMLMGSALPLTIFLPGPAIGYASAFVLLSCLVDFWKFSKAINRLRYQTFIFLVMIFATISIVSALAVYKHYEKDDLVAKEKFANRLLIRNDIIGEYYLSEIIQEISQDRYVRTRLMSKILARQNIREKIKRQFLASYFKKYDIDVYLFDPAGESLQPDVSTKSYESWQGEYAIPEYHTDYDGIYFMEDREENVRNKYLCFLEISAYGRQVGYILLELTLKKYIPSSVFPELLLESKYYLGSKVEFDYAVYKNGEMLYKQGRYSFENKLSGAEFQDEELYDAGLEKGGYHYFGLKTVDNRTVIIVSPTYGTQAILANSSFMFLLLVFFTGFLFLGARIFISGGQLNLSTKIQIYLGLSFLLPMLVVSVALINTLNSSYREEIDRNFQKRSYNIAENILDQSEMFFSNQINIDEYANEIVEAATLAQSDLNIYDLNGRLVTTSQPEIFRLGLLSRLLDTKAYYQIKNKREQNIILDETIGKLDFKTSYTALRSYKDGRLMAFLSMPYFDSKNHLRQQQVEVFNSLVVIFSIIFLISLLGGNVIVGQLVRPLKKIGERIRKISLEETNQPIHYEAQDEIGSLVKEYNIMLVKLEESKEALAAIQKESAWNEIARQVAHEIKNPLTPMRLKIQQMMRSFESESKEYKTCEALISQVDSLSSIADSFSEFAKMPAPNNEPVEVIGLLNKTIDLYQSNEVALKKAYEVKSVMVYLDPKIFSRIITNILLNAIQSKETTEMHKIKVGVRVSGDKMILSVADSGMGISDEQKEKVFTPYFSTKSKGSGIGLAVAKKGIENAGGNIWFESEQGKGTTFYISLPVYSV